MSYEINVSLKGKHYFATSDRSLRSEDAAVAMAKHFKELFPESEGYQITVRRILTTMQEVTVE